MSETSYTPGTIPGVIEMRPIAHRLYGVRIAGGLTYKLKKVEKFTRAGIGSSLFAFSIPENMEDTIESAQEQFLKIVKEAGLGQYFGIYEDKNFPKE